MAEEGQSYDEQVRKRVPGFNRYLTSYLKDVFDNIHNAPPERIPLFEIRKRAKGLLGRLSALWPGRGEDAHSTPMSESEKKNLLKEMWFNFNHANELNAVMESLGDDRSKVLLSKVHSFRSLGPGRMSLLGDSATDKALSFSGEHFLEEKNVGSLQVGRESFTLNQYDLSPLGSTLRLVSSDVALFVLFILKQYAYASDEAVVDVAPGDIVIDGGMCAGETSLYFAEKTGADGRVYGFEFMEEHLDLIQRNLLLNEPVADRITVMGNALWHTSGLMLNISSKGPASRVGTEESDFKVESLSIDDLVEQEGLERVDFIKLDIEGAEKGALQGAEKTIRMFRPKLAISAYHLTDDLVLIPAMLKEMNPGYTLYLKHVTPGRQETVLFAV